MSTPTTRWSRVFAAACASVVAWGVSACGTSDAGSESDTLTVWMKEQLLPEQNKAVEARAEAFGAANGIDVNVETIAYEDFYPKWSAALESGDVPDVSYFGYQEVGQFYAQGILEDVSDVVTTIEKANGPMTQILKQPVTFEGAQYAVPFWAEAQVLYYRTDLFDKAGVSEPPATWEDFRAVAAKLTSDGTYGAGIGYGEGNSDAEFFTRALAWSYGGSLDASSEESGGTEDANEQAANLIRDIFLTDKSAPSDAVGWDDAGNNEAYLGGQAAMVFNTGSLLATLKTEDPQLYKNTEIAPYPAGPAGTVSPGIENNLGIFSASDNKEVAKEFIAHTLDKDWHQRWTDAGAPLNIPVYDDVRSSHVWTDQRNQAFAEAVDDFTFLGSPSAYSPAAGEIYNLRLVNDAFAQILVNGEPVQEALSSLRESADEVYEDQAG